MNVLLNHDFLEEYSELSGKRTKVGVNLGIPTWISWELAWPGSKQQVSWAHSLAAVRQVV